MMLVEEQVRQGFAIIPCAVSFQDAEAFDLTAFANILKIHAGLQGEQALTTMWKTGKPPSSRREEFTL